MTESRTITYRGNPAVAGALVQLLEEQGVAVRWDRPTETHGGAQSLQDRVVTIAAMGAPAAIRVAVRTFRARFPRTRVDYDDEDDD